MTFSAHDDPLLPAASVLRYAIWFAAIDHARVV